MTSIGNTINVDCKSSSVICILALNDPICSSSGNQINVIFTGTSILSPIGSTILPSGIDTALI